MNPTDENLTASDQSHTPVRRRGCLSFFVVLLLFLLLGAIRIYHPRFKATLPSRIEFHARQYDDVTNTDWLYKTSVTDSAACRVVIDAFKRGTWAMPHMCKESATFEIHYENGAVDYVDFMPGHDGPDFCEIRMGLGHYRLLRKDLIQILSQAGVDPSKIPVD